MDKLKPILAHKFWILFSVGLILPIVGYFMTKGGLATEIETRRSKLKTTFDGIPQGIDSPNEQWINGALLENEKLVLSNRQANKELWDAQKVRMSWPKDVAGIMSKAEYFKPVPANEGASRVADKYQYDYPDELRKLWESVDPLDDGQNFRDSNVRRKMVFAMLSLQQANYSKWVDLPPTFDEIWACQEDIWLQTELLGAVARINKNNLSITDANIKQLGKITMFGGTTQKDPSTGAGGGTGGSGGGDVNLSMIMSGAGGGGSSSGRPTDAKLSADIALAEEFVAEIESGGGNAAPGGAIGFDSSGSSAGIKESGGGGATGAAPKSAVKRYLDDDEAQKFKRRGFYIKLVMDHRKVPELLAELMNSPFPVEIVRVHQVWISDSSTNSPLGGSPMAAFSAGGGSGSGPGAFATGGFAKPEGDDASAAPAFGSSSSSGPRPGAAGASGQTAMADPNLASVSILGIWTLYRPNVELPTTGSPSSAGGAPADVAANATANGSVGTASAATEETAAAESPASETTTESAPAKSEETGNLKEAKETPKGDKEGNDKPSEEPAEKPAAEPKASADPKTD